MGNHDRDFILGFAEQRNFSHVSKQHREYVFQQLKGYENVFMKFPLYTTRICGGKKLLFEHYCRAGNSGIVTFKPLAPLPSAEIFDEMYKDYDCDFDAVFFGHKHEPFDIVGKRLYVDVGSVGCHPEPNACGIIIEYDDSSWSYRRFSVPYDQDETRKAMTDGPLPDGAGLFDFYFLRKKPKTN